MSDARARAIQQAWDEAQAWDQENLPGVPRVVRPGPYGTFAEDTRQHGPEAPALDNGPLYTGEWREDVDGDFLTLGVGPTSFPVGSFSFLPLLPTCLATLRRVWSAVGFSLDTSRVPAGVSIMAGLAIVTRNGRAMLNSTGVIPVAPVLASTGAMGMIALSNISPGARVEVVAAASAEGVQARACLWGYNVPGFGP